MSEPISLQLTPSPIETIATPETTPEQNIIQAYLELAPLQEIFQSMEQKTGDSAQPVAEQIRQAMQTEGFLEILEQTETDPELAARFAEDLRESYELHEKYCPSTIQELHQRTRQVIALGEMNDPKGPLQANSHDYLIQRSGPLITIPSYIAEMPHLKRLLPHQQHKFARLLASLRQLDLVEQKAATDEAAAA